MFVEFCHWISPRVLSQWSLGSLHWPKGAFPYLNDVSLHSYIYTKKDTFLWFHVRFSYFEQKGVFGLLTIPAALICLVGIILHEPQTVNFSYKQVDFPSFLISIWIIPGKSCDYLLLNQVGQKFRDAIRAMGDTLKLPDVWRPCLYLYLSNALSLNIYDGMFYWYTDSIAGPHFSQVWFML